ncbi:pentatricopeptide repeat-containing protein At4g02750-like isoform X1 [Aristolochia californica]|uniref:pentatricopeptide repeat-containing protein At4g02750-like isoform X1 n=1 Tax=Aristolochia californica TaxID=171875 RepID=UPI0035DEF7AB
MLRRAQKLKIRVTWLLYAKRCLSHEFANSQLNVTKSSKRVFSGNVMITDCFRRGDVEAARLIFDEMPKRNLVTWNCMISGYIRSSNLSEAQKIFNIMPKRNVVSWSALLNGYAKCGLLWEAQQLFEKMPEKNIVCWNSMISGYLNHGEFGKAREFFNKMPIRNSISWAIMVAGYLHQGLLTEAQELFDQAPNKSTYLYNSLLSAYVEQGCMEDACNLFSEVPQKDEATWTTMITGYSRVGEMEHARRLFEQMPGKCIEACTAIIWGYMQSGDVKSAQIIFDNMASKDVVVWNTIMGGYVQNKMFGDALKLFIEMPISDIWSWNLILLGHIQEGNMIKAFNFFLKMPEHDQTSWNTIISGYQSEEALVLFSQMINDGFRPNQGTFTIVVSVCASLASIGWGTALHICAIKSGYEYDTKVRSSLITMYAKCGSLAEASDLFQSMSKQDTIAWNAMIVALAYNGCPEEALKLLPSMIRLGLNPDHVTFLGFLSACSHKGLVNKGLEIFNYMQSHWKLIPKFEHYNCVVDLLGRSGQLSEVFEFISKMPVDIPIYTWETLLGACKVHGNLELAEIVAQEILNFKPSDGGAYVVLSNIYASKGIWVDASRTRSLIKEHGAKKEQACSWIEIKGKTDTFVSSDTSHPKRNDIYKVLGTLSLIMEEVVIHS